MNKVRAGEMAPLVRVLALVQDLSLVPEPHGGSQPPIAPVPRDPTPAFGLLLYACSVHACV